MLLDDDATVERGWLEWLVATADANPQAGAVGSCILFPDGRLQEAGSVIWREGWTTGVGRGTDGSSLAWYFVRRVDYSSGCSLLVRRECWERLGGMDESYVPIYFEDVDFCLRLREIGRHVLFEPRSRVTHHETSSSAADFKLFLMSRYRSKLLERWGGELALHEPTPTLTDATLDRAVWRARGCPRRVLIVDDFVPEPSFGSGFGRMYETIVDLADAGYAVSLLPTCEASTPPDRLVDRGLAILEGDLAALLRHPATWYDVVIASRPFNFEKASPLVKAHQPWASMIYDCEALFWRRTARQAELMPDPAEADRLRVESAAMRRVEERNASQADVTVAISEDEATLLRAVPGQPDVRVVPPIESDVEMTSPGFHERRDLAFVAGWMAGPTSPNADALRWFVDHVLPIVRGEMPWVRLRVTGRNPPPELTALAGPNLDFEGHVPDLRAFYEQVRVVVSPVRFGAGVKLKTVQAMQFAVPTVTTSIGAEGIDVEGFAALEIADDAETFARAVIRLLSDEAAWNHQRQALAGLAERWLQARATRPWRRIVDELCERRLDGGRPTFLQP
jgi:glycosyltransferase involved in cell wall biosynthesis